MKIISIMYPTTIKLLANEIKRLSDDYISRKISEQTFRGVILHYAYNNRKMFFSKNDPFDEIPYLLFL